MDGVEEEFKNNLEAIWRVWKSSLKATWRQVQGSEKGV